MTLPNILYALRWLIWDTFRQAMTSGMMWVMLCVTAVCILLCLSISIEGGESTAPPGEYIPHIDPNSPEAQKLKSAANRDIEVLGGKMSFAFGLFPITYPGLKVNIVHFIELLLAGAVADTFGVLLALVWTAGFLPTFLEPSVSSVLLAKPLPRWALLVGKYIGVMAFVLFQAVLFVFGTWIALGMKTGVWNSGYLLTIPMLLLHFGIFFSFSVFLAVCTRSTIVCVIGSLLFWLMCWGMNFGRLAVMKLGLDQQLEPPLYWTVEISYWILPKPADFGYLLYKGLGASKDFSIPIDFEYLEHGLKVFYPTMSVLTSILFAVAVLGVSAYQFVTTDY